MSDLEASTIDARSGFADLVRRLWFYDPAGATRGRTSRFRKAGLRVGWLLPCAVAIINCQAAVSPAADSRRR
jgi:hypothetical protein